MTTEPESMAGRPAIHGHPFRLCNVGLMTIEPEMGCARFATSERWGWQLRTEALASPTPAPTS